MYQRDGPMAPVMAQITRINQQNKIHAVDEAIIKNSENNNKNYTTCITSTTLQLNV